MGSFIGHFGHGLAFFFVGLWRLLSVISLFVKDPDSFRSRPWYPTKFSGFLLKRLELLIVTFAGCCSIASELFITPSRHQPLDDDWSIPMEHLRIVEHATMALCFVLFGSLCLFVEARRLSLPRGWLHIVGLFTLSQELLLFHFHSTEHGHAEGHYHHLFQLIIVVSLIAGTLEIFVPTSAAASIVLNASFLFQGTWLMRTGLHLYIPSFIATGCKIVRDDERLTNAFVCDTPAAEMRAQGLANLTFTWDLLVILTLTMVYYFWSLMRVRGSAGHGSQYEQLLNTSKNTQGNEETYPLDDEPLMNGASVGL